LSGPLPPDPSASCGTDHQVEDPPEPFDGEAAAGVGDLLVSLEFLEVLASDDPVDGDAAGVADESDPDPDEVSDDPESDEPASDFAAGTVDSPGVEEELPERLSVL
jgi:hypothetical protein